MFMGCLSAQSSGSLEDFDAATNYSYGNHGNMDTLVQHCRVGMMAVHAVNSAARDPNFFIFI
jgi:hypothetical protein